MRVPIVCAQCMQEDVASARIVRLAEFSDGNSYEVECDKGHKAVVILQEQKFEILFDIGAYAIVDGYYREAVSSFTSSLERFFEFFIHANLKEHKIAAANVMDCWKLVSAQSERQFGAYIFLYALVTHSAPPVLERKYIEFRNEVIHKGRIPNREEAIRYGNRVLDIMRAGIATTKQFCPTGFDAMPFENTISGASRAFEEGKKSATASVGTIVGLNIAEPTHHARTLEEALAALPDWRKRSQT